MYPFLRELPRPVYRLARLDPARPVFVVEGLFDYIILWQWGYQTVAAMGTSIKPEDAHKLARAARVVFVPDNDETGEAAAARWQKAVGHSAVLRLPERVGDVNDLALRTDGEAVSHRLARELEVRRCRTAETPDGRLPIGRSPPLTLGLPCGSMPCFRDLLHLGCC